MSQNKINELPQSVKDSPGQVNTVRIESGTENIIETEFIITKASLDDNGRMLWAATASDTDPDSYDEKMSLNLYQSFIDALDNSNPPYISLAHYGKLNGLGDAGVATEIYIQGKQLKAKGYFHDTPLGVSIFNAIREDRRNNKSQNERIRISIGFYDRMHSHSNGTIWDFSSNKPCTQCALGVGGKVYLKGILEHLAVTRVPVNKRTDITAKSESEDMTTRYEDAVSIVGEHNKDIVDDIEKAHQTKAKNKSESEDGLIEKADSGPGLFNVLTQLDNQQVLELFKRMGDDGEISEDRISKLVNEILNEMSSRSETEPVEKHEDIYLPFGGATSMGDAREYMQAAKLENNAYYAYSMFGAVANNILATDDKSIEDKLSAMQTLLSEFRGYLDPKKLMELSEAEDKPVEITTNTSAPEVEIKANTEDSPVAIAASTSDIKPLEDRISVLEQQLKSLTTQHPASVELEVEKVETANSEIQSVVDEFSTNLSDAFSKTGEERNIALQEVINRAGVRMLEINRSITETETPKTETQTVPATNPVELSDAINKAIDEKLAPTNQMINQLGTQLDSVLRALQGQQITRSTEKTPPQPFEVPQMKSIVLPNGMLPKTPSEGMSIREIVAKTTF